MEFLTFRLCRGALALWLLAAPAALHAQALESAVKATFLYKFALYVEWPAAAFSGPASPLQLCVAGNDGFATTVEDAARGQRIAGREVAVRRLNSGADGCHILFAGGDAAPLLAAARGRPVLTVTDNRAADSAGIINFAVRDNRVRFTVDDAAAAQNGLVISSKLLSLALEVKLRSTGDARGSKP